MWNSLLLKRPHILGILFQSIQAIEVKGRSMLNFEAVTLKFGNHSWKFGCQPQKSIADLCMTNRSKVLIPFALLTGLGLLKKNKKKSNTLSKFDNNLSLQMIWWLLLQFLQTWHAVVLSEGKVWFQSLMRSPPSKFFFEN